MVKILIADDVKKIRESLEQTLNDYLPGAEIVAATESVKDTIDAIEKHKPDVLLLDIEMKGGTGFDVLKHFKRPPFKVIFVTAYQQYTLEAFRFSALDYLLKPVDPDQLLAAVNKAIDQVDRERLTQKIDTFLYNMEHASKGPKKIVLKTAESMHVVSLPEIVYCEATQGYTNIYLADKSRILVSKTLGEYDDMLAPFNFLRIHQSFLVNINFIKRYEKSDGGKVVLSNEVSLPVSVRKKDHLMQILSRL